MIFKMKNYAVPDFLFPQEIKPGLFLIGNYFFNLFLIKGKQWTVLFETGVSAVVDDVIHQIDGLGLEPDYLIPAHPHSDHITGLPGLREHFPQAAVLITKEAQAFIEHPKAGSAMLFEDRFLYDSLPDHGVTPGRPPLESVPDLKGCRQIHGDHDLDLGGLTLCLKSVRGHAPGSYIAWIPERKTILTSDSLGFHFPGRGFFPLFFTGMNAYLDTLDTIEGMDADLLCPAHQMPIESKDIPETFRQIRKTINDLIVRVKTVPAENLVKDLFDRTYRDEFSLYSPDNIENCIRLLIRRIKDAI